MPLLKGFPPMLFFQSFPEWQKHQVQTSPLKNVRLLVYSSLFFKGGKDKYAKDKKNSGMQPLITLQAM
jgi:hypothetical protein